MRVYFKRRVVYQVTSLIIKVTPNGTGGYFSQTEQQKQQRVKLVVIYYVFYVYLVSWKFNFSDNLEGKLLRLYVFSTFY